MHRRCGEILCLCVVLLASGVFAQDAVVFGPTLSANAEKTSTEGVLIAPHASPLSVTESLPLGQSMQGSFHDRLLSGGKLEVQDPKMPPTLDIGEGWWRTAGVLVIIIALILILAALFRRLVGRSGGMAYAMSAGGRAPSGLLHVLGRYPIGRGQSLVVLKLDRRVILVSQSFGAKGHGMRTLCEFDDPEEVAAIILQASEAEGRTLSKRFREMISGFESSYDDTEGAAVAVDTPTPVQPVVTSMSDPVNMLHTRLDSLRNSEQGWVS